MLIKIQLLKYSNRHVAEQSFYVSDDIPPEAFQEILKFIEKKIKECDKTAPPEKPSE